MVSQEELDVTAGSPTYMTGVVYLVFLRLLLQGLAMGERERERVLHLSSHTG